MLVYRSVCVNGLECFNMRGCALFLNADKALRYVLGHDGWTKMYPTNAPGDLMVVIRMVESINKSLPKQIQEIVLWLNPPNIAIKHEKPQQLRSGGRSKALPPQTNREPFFLRNIIFQTFQCSVPSSFLGVGQVGVPPQFFWTKLGLLVVENPLRRSS